MEVSKLTTKDIFGRDRHIVVPIYQRPYVWTREEQWEPFWNDIRLLAEQLIAGKEPKPHFLGAIVLDQQLTAAGSMDTRLVIDGQQRLTTVQLILEAFCDLAGRFEDTRYALSLLRLTRNDDPLSTNKDERFKLWPSNIDQTHFELVMQCHSPDELVGKYDAKRIGNSIGEAYAYFYKTMEGWLRLSEDGADKRIEKLLAAVKDLLLFVVIDLAQDEDAQAIFETLNARMTPLLQSDLVKNSLFYAAHQEKENLLDVYNAYWSDFDKNADYWRADVTRGRLIRPRIEYYLQNLLVLLTRDDVRMDQLHRVYNTWAATSGKSATEQLDVVKRYAQTYWGFDHAPADTRESLFFYRLGIMQQTTVYPLLLKLYSVSPNGAKDLRQVFDDLESFLVRRMICRLTSKNYNRLFVDLISTVEAEDQPGEPARAPADKLRESLLSFDADSTRWPRDDEFKHAWMELPTYYYITVDRVRMLLEAIDQTSWTPLSEKVKYGGGLTIEHLMPQKWADHYPLPNSEPKEVATVTRNRVIHTMGNL